VTRTTTSTTPRAGLPGRTPAPAGRLLVRVCLLSTLLLVAATLLAIVAGWPAQFGGPGDPDAVAAEFLTRGTALSPPAVPLALFAGAALLSRRGGAAGVVATVVLMLLGVVFVVGGLGEAVAPATADVPALALMASGGAAALLGVAVLVLGALALRERAARRGTSSA
jgi:hypothetical protein